MAIDRHVAVRNIAFVAWTESLGAESVTADERLSSFPSVHSPGQAIPLRVLVGQARMPSA